MKVNPDKFQTTIVNKNNKISDEYYLNVRETKVTSEKSGIKLRIKIKNKLSFENHISVLCRKATEAVTRGVLLKRCS